MPRIADIYAAIPSMTGKLELEYEGELVGGATIASELIRRAADSTLKAHAPHAATDDIVMWFDGGAALQVTDDAAAGTLRAAFETVPGLTSLVIHHGLANDDDDALVAGACELVLDVVQRMSALSVEHLDVTANPEALVFYTKMGFTLGEQVATRFGPGHRMRLVVKSVLQSERR